MYPDIWKNTDLSRISPGVIMPLDNNGKESAVLGRTKAIGQLARFYKMPGKQNVSARACSLINAQPSTVFKRYPCHRIASERLEHETQELCDKRLINKISLLLIIFIKRSHRPGKQA